MHEVTGLLVAMAVYAAATLLLFAPVVADIGGRLGPDFGDPLFNLYVMKWGAHQLSIGLPDLWNAPFFYPAQGTLALSDHLIGPAAALLGLRLLGVSSIAGFNLLFLATFVLGAWNTCWVLRRTGLSWAGALLGGWVFAYSNFRWGDLSHYQLLRMQWLPPLLWSFDRLLDSPSGKRALAFVAFYALHVSGGTYLAHLAHLPLLVLLLNRLSPERLRDWRSWRAWAPAAAACVAMAALAFGPYLFYETPHRPLEAVRRFGGTILAFATPSARSAAYPLFPAWLRAAGRRYLFPGFAVCALASVALLGGLRKYAGDAPPPSKARRLGGFALATVGITAMAAGLVAGDRFTLRRGGNGYLAPLVLTLSAAATTWLGLRLVRGGRLLRWREIPAWPRGLLLGGAVGLPLCLPMFFWGAGHVIPGLAGMRVSSRTWALVSLPLAYLAAAGWDALRARGRGETLRRTVAVTLALVAVAESLPARAALSWRSLPEERGFPAYSWFIARSPDVRAYVELPLTRRGYGEAMAMYFQSIHWRPLVNGYSGFVPDASREISRVLKPLPDLDGVLKLRRLGVTHVVAHWDALSWQPGLTRRRALLGRASFEAAVARAGGHVVFTDGSTDVWALGPTVAPWNPGGCLRQ